ncbi:MAG: hypothetical protein LUE25_01460 [Clostridiales bacterium]|nr:hypothetical protein [Clostridiales bacterium]
MLKLKKFALLLVAALVLSVLAACSGETGTEATNQVITRGASEDETNEDTNASGTDASATAMENADDASEEAFYFETDGVTIIPGTALDLSVLPDANDTYTVPSCAIDGTDNVYMYDTFELTAYDEGNGEIIYSIYLTDANITTPEGLALGDDASRVIELYGEDYEESGTSMTYTKGSTELIIILQNDVVVSIEYMVIL